MKISDRARFATDHGHKHRFSLTGAALAALVMLPHAGAVAAEAELYTVSDVAVDATAETAAKGRGIAHAQGVRIAFKRLIGRLVPIEKQAEVPVPEPAVLATLVRNFEVDDEKTSRVRYLAKMRIRFDRAAIRRLLRDAAIPYAETRSKPLLVLPVLRRAGAHLLWDNPNPWRTAWSGLRISGGLVPLMLPKGGLQDVSFISAEQAVRGEMERLGAIARRYDAYGAVVVVARMKFDTAQNLPAIEVSVRRTNDPQRRIWRNSITALPDQSQEDLIQRAARETASFVQEQWKSENLLRFDQQNEMIVNIPLDDLGDWVGMRKRLDDIAYVSKSELVALSRRSARVRIHYLGGQEQLRTAFTQNDLSLTAGPDQIWVLRMIPKRPRRSADRASDR